MKKEKKEKCNVLNGFQTKRRSLPIYEFRIGRKEITKNENEKSVRKKSGAES